MKFVNNLSEFILQTKDKIVPILPSSFNVLLVSADKLLTKFRGVLRRSLSMDGTPVKMWYEYTGHLLDFSSMKLSAPLHISLEGQERETNAFKMQYTPSAKIPQGQGTPCCHLITSKQLYILQNLCQSTTGQTYLLEVTAAVPTPSKWKTPVFTRK